MSNVNSFTQDLNEAKDIFSKIGVDLTGLDLEPIAEVVEKLKENKSDLASILDSMKEADFASHIEQVKNIDWSSLLASIEEIMGFIHSKNRTTSEFVTPKIPSSFQTEDSEDFFSAPSVSNVNLNPPPRGLTLTPPPRKP